VHERDVQVETSGAVLSGTFCCPSGAGRFPSVLMLGGSGPLDRNENALGQRLDIFNSIAHSLASAGIASLRYDKRGCGKSSGSYYQAGYFDFVADAGACFAYLRRHEQCDAKRIYTLGHSEGTLTAMHMSLQHPEVAGLIQLCPFLEGVESAVLRQAHHVQVAASGLTGIRGVTYRAVMRLQGDPIVAQRRLIERVKSNRARPRELERRHLGLKWFREILALDPRQVYAQMRRPMLLIAGAKDHPV